MCGPRNLHFKQTPWLLLIQAVWVLHFGKWETCTDRGIVAGIMVTGSGNEKAGRDCGTAFSPISSSLR